MKKVRCIKDSNYHWIEGVRRFFGLYTRWRPTDGPGYGDICLVLKETVGAGERWYVLLEWGFTDEFLASQFEDVQEDDKTTVYENTNRAGEQLRCPAEVASVPQVD